MRRFAPLALALALGCGEELESVSNESATEGDPAVLEFGPCLRVADCETERGGLVTPLLAQYGEDGTCWGEFPAEACWQDCRAILNAGACQLIEACCECSTSADCGFDETNPTCIDGACAALGTAPASDLPAEEYLVLLHLSVQPDTPVQLVGTIGVEEGIMTLDLEFLSLNILSDSEPRLPTSVFLQVGDIPVDSNGSFEFALEDMTVIGAANPITGSDMLMAIQVEGQLQEGQLCGALAGSVSVPADINLSGSRFAAIPTGGMALPAADSPTCAES